MECFKNTFGPLIKQNGIYYQSVPQKSMRSDIQVLRCLAVVLVVLFHLDIPFFKGGFAGVDIFFVISGYLVIGSIFKGLLEDKFNYFIFLAGRVKRLFPASFICLLFVFCLFLIFPNIQKMAGNLGWYDITWASAHGANIKFFINENQYFRSDNTVSFLLHYWTLALEEQFYLIAPLILMIFHAIQKLIVPKEYLNIGLAIFTLIAIIGSFITCLLPQVSTSHKFFLLHARVWEFLSGSLIALYQSKITEFITNNDENCPEWRKHFNYWLRYVFIFGLILFGIFTPSGNYPNSITLAIVILTCATLAINEPINNLFLESIGNWSYSIYLYHFPIIQLFKQYPLMNENLKIVSILIITMVLAILSFYFIEQEALKINIFPLGWYIIVAALSAGLAVGATLLFSYPNFIFMINIHNSSSFYNKTGPFEFTTEPTKLEILKYNSDIAGYTGVLAKNMESYFTKDPSIKLLKTAGENSDPSKCILAYGDSNIMQWFPSLKRLSLAINYTSLFFANSFSTQIYDLQEAEYFITLSMSDLEFQKCTSLITIFSRVSLGIWFYSDEQISAVKSGMQRLNDYFGKKGCTAIIESIPRQPGEYNANVCVHNEIVKNTANFTEVCALNKLTSVYDYNKLIQNTNISSDTLLNMNKYLCTGNLCVPNYHEIPIYMDQTHISEAFAEFLAPTFIDEIINMKCTKTIL